MSRQLTFLPPRRPLRERLGGEFFRQLPTGPGVYLLCGSADGVLYVGKAKNLRQRLGSYRSANPDRVPRKLRRLLTAVERILWDECPSEAAALARERELLRTLRPRFNTVGVRPSSPDWLGWRCVAGGLELGWGEGTAGWPERHGPFSQIRPLFGSLLRLLWWRLHAADPGLPPESVRPAAGTWADMPRPLTAGRPPRCWRLEASPATAGLAQGLLRSFFQDGSLDLIEWCLAVAESRPRFERAWMERDALPLLEVYERRTAGTDAELRVH